MEAPRPLRVLNVIARMNVGGPALVVTALASGLDPARFEFRLVTGLVDEGEQDYRELRAPDVDAEVITGLGRAPRPLDDVRALAHLTRLMRSFRPDIVHTRTAKAGALGRVAAKAARVPAIVHTFHGHLLHGYFNPAVTKAVVLAERGLAMTTTRFFVEGAIVRDELIAAGIGSLDRYRVVPAGVEVPTAVDPDVARKELGLPSGVPVIAFIGRLTRIKRPDRLLEAFGQISRDYPDAVVAIAGEGDLVAEVREAAAVHGDRVRFLGWRKDVGTVLSAADVVALTSDNEGMPLSLMEAGMAGVPAVTTNVGSAGEVVADGETGLVTDVDAAAVARALRVLLGDPALRRRMGEAAAVRARALFGVDHHVALTAELYEEIAAERGLRKGSA